MTECLYNLFNNSHKHINIPVHTSALMFLWQHLGEIGQLTCPVMRIQKMKASMFLKIC